MGTIKIYGTMKSGGVSSWYEITGAPTTLAGYGITDASNISLTNFVAANSATWGTGGGEVSLATVTAASAAALSEAQSYTNTAVSVKANSSHFHTTSDVTDLDTIISNLSSAIDGKQASGSYADSTHTHHVSAITNAASVSLVVEASAAAAAAAAASANSNFIPLAGGTITGNLSVLGALTYIDTNVAVTSAMYIDTASSETALRVTQKGSGDAIRVEDTNNPDLTPFIVNSDGLVGIGTAAPNKELTVIGNVSATGSYYGDATNLTGTPTFTDVNANAYKVTSSAFNAQVGTTYTLVAGDNGEIITMNNSSASTVIVPSGLGAGFSATIIQLGTGQVTVSAGAGVTMNSYLGYTKTAGQHAGVSLIAYLANTFNLNGNLA
jgi:hypothetical protein